MSTSYATLLPVLLLWPVIVLGFDEGGKATPYKEMAEDRPQASVEGAPSSAVSTAEPEAKDKVVQREANPPQADSNPPQADRGGSGEVIEEADILEEELPIIIMEDGGPPQAAGRTGGATTGKR